MIKKILLPWLLLTLTVHAGDETGIKTKSPTSRLGIYASPITFSRVNDEKSFTYGASWFRDYKNHETRIMYERNAFSSTDSINEITVKSSEHEAILTHDINNVWKNLSIFALMTYERESEGDIQLKAHQIRGGILGLKYKVYQGKKLNDITLSYIPLFEYIDELAETDESTLINQIFKRVITRGIRHSFRFRIRLKLFHKKLSVNETFYYRPLTGFNGEGTSFSDVDLENIFKITYNINENISFSYRNKYSWDRHEKNVYHLPSSDMEHRILIEFTRLFGI